MILGSSSFDVTQIDLSTVAYVSAEGPPVLDAFFGDVDRDGFLDCVFQVDLSESDIGCCDFGAVLVGKTFGGAAFAAPIRIKDKQ